MLPHTTTINRNSGRVTSRVAVPRVTGLQFEFVVAHTLERIYTVQGKVCLALTGPRRKVNVVRENSKHTVYVMVKPTPHMLAIGCDACSGRHTHTNIRCMASTPESLLHAAQAGLYKPDRVRSHRTVVDVIKTSGKRSIVVLSK